MKHVLVIFHLNIYKKKKKMYHVKNNINKKFICFDKKKNTKVKTKRYFPCKWPYFIELYPRARNFVYICFHQYSMILFPYITIYNKIFFFSCWYFCKHPSLQFYLMLIPSRLFCLYWKKLSKLWKYESIKDALFMFSYFFFIFSREYSWAWRHVMH